MPQNLTSAMALVSPRLRSLRKANGQTLAELAELTVISVSTSSRLKTGKRKVTLELLVALAQVHQVLLDDIVKPSAPGDPRVRAEPTERDGVTVLALTNQSGPLQAYKFTMRAGADRRKPQLRTHPGKEWLTC